LFFLGWERPEDLFGEEGFELFDGIAEIADGVKVVGLESMEARRSGSRLLSLVGGALEREG
jgi:hypothetical protein